MDSSSDSTKKSKKHSWKKKLPPRFLFWLEAMGLEIVLVQPENINEFACHFFEKQIARRNTDIINVPIKSYYLDICSRRVLAHKRSSEGEFIELKTSVQSYSLEKECRRDSLKANIPLDDEDDEIDYTRSVEIAKKRQSMEQEDDIADQLNERADIYIPHAEDMMGESMGSGSQQTAGTRGSMDDVDREDHERRSSQPETVKDEVEHVEEYDAGSYQYRDEYGGGEHEEYGAETKQEEYEGYRDHDDYEPHRDVEEFDIPSHDGHFEQHHGGYGEDGDQDEYGGHKDHEEYGEHRDDDEYGEHKDHDEYGEHGGLEEYGEHGGHEEYEHRDHEVEHEHKDHEVEHEYGREGEDRGFPEDEWVQEDLAVSVVQVEEEGSIKYGEETGEDWEKSSHITDVKPESSNVDFEPNVATEEAYYYDEAGDQDRPKTPHETAEECAQTSEIRAQEISCGMSNDILSADDESVATAADEIRSEPDTESQGGDAAHIGKESLSLAKSQASDKKQHSHKSKYGHSSFSDNPAPGVNVSGTISVATAKKMKDVNDGAVAVEIAAETEDEDNDIIDVEINLHCHCTP